MNKDDENKAVQQPAAAEESSQQTASEQDSGLPKTQEELDALIEKRLARERKKLAKASPGTQASALRRRKAVRHSLRHRARSQAWTLRLWRKRTANC